MVVDGADAGQIQLCRHHGAGEYLHTDCQQASDCRWSIANAGVAGRGSRRGGRNKDETGGEERDEGGVLAAHGDLHGVNIDGGVDYHAAAGRLSAALLEEELYVLGGVAGSLQHCVS